MRADVLEHAASDGSYNGAEEDEEEADIEASVFARYLEVCDEGTGVDSDTDALFAKGLLRVQQYLAGGRDNSTCPICLGGIKPTEAIWSCSKSCFALFHMTCMQEWGRNQLDTAAYKASRATHDPAAAPAAGREWGCPSCRFDYPAAELPQRYSCFCGKKEDPEWDPWLAPHSCGELCGKPLPGSCTHACLLLCHPGPCPPCPLLVDASCFCGKAVMKQRCGNNEFSCRGVCGKVLPCGHTCPDACHPGPCAPCVVVVEGAPCACGAQATAMRCCDSAWRCDRVCGKTLACGRHSCDQVCHAGPCGPCPEEGERHCPCGKALYPDLKCDERSPLCGGTCGKTLDCGVHTCQERCHYGPCNKVCRELVNKPCRCGRTQKQVLCSADVRCDSKCNNMRSCDRHPCKRRCCDGACPPCEEVCNRKLRCGNHRCPATCHRGPCRPCPLSQTISCACGKTSYTLPCGAEATAAPPRCNKPCPVLQVCRHAGAGAGAGGAAAAAGGGVVGAAAGAGAAAVGAVRAHRCHFGPCPTCRAPCGSTLPCGHTCSSSTCHDAHPPAVAAFERPRPPKSHAAAAAAAAGNAGGGGGSSSSAGVGVGVGDTKRGGGSSSGGGGEGVEQQPAAAAMAAAMAAAAAAAGGGSGLRACPPCPVPVAVGCLGGHCQRQLPCHSAAAFSCEAACGLPLACGNHTCSKPCHAVKTPAGVGSSSAAAAAAAAAAVAGVSEECERCVRPCDKPRSCPHPCPSTCHPGACEPCVVQTHMECHCGKTDLSFPCHQQQQIVLREQQQQQGQQGRKGSTGVASSAAAAAAAAGAGGAEDPLCCGKVCNRDLPFCPHSCAAACHTGACPAAASCGEEVTVRCSCRRQKEKWSCAKVQAALAAAAAAGSGGSSGGRLYDGSSALKLLECDGLCAAAAAKAPSKQQAVSSSSRDISPVPGTTSSSSSSSGAVKQEQPPPAPAAAAAAAGAGGGGGVKSLKKLSRAERDALAAAKEAERQKQQRQQQLRQAGFVVAVVLLVVVVGLCLSLGLEKLLNALKAVDRSLQQKYAPGQPASHGTEL